MGEQLLRGVRAGPEEAEGISWAGRGILVGVSCQLASLHKGILLGFQEQVALPGVLALRLPWGQQQT